MVTQRTGQQTYTPPPLPNGQAWSPNAVPVRFDPTTRQWSAFFNGTWTPRPDWTFDQVNAMGRAGQAFQVDYAASGGQANTAAVQREIAPRVFAPDSARLTPEGGITGQPATQVQGVTPEQMQRVFAPDTASLSPQGAILSTTPPPAASAPAAPAPPPSQNIDPGANWDYSGAPPATTTPAAPKRQPEELTGALANVRSLIPPAPPGQEPAPNREQMWLQWLLGSADTGPGAPAATPAFRTGGYQHPRYAEGGSQNFAPVDGGGEVGEWVFIGDHPSGKMGWKNTATGQVIYTDRLTPPKLTSYRYAEGGTHMMPDGSMMADSAMPGPLPLPDAIVGEGLETQTPQFDTEHRGELLLEPRPELGPDIFKVTHAEGPTGVQADRGMLVLPLSDPAEAIAREHLRPSEGISGEMNGSQFESGPLSLPTTPGGAGAAPSTTPALATGGSLPFELKPNPFGVPTPQQPQGPEGVPPLNPGQVHKGLYPPASLAGPSQEWQGLPGGAPPPLGNVNDFSRMNEAQRQRYDQWLKSMGILSGIQGIEADLRRSAPGRLALPTVAG